VQVFVTGGSGYVGRNLVDALVARGDTVRALARSEDAASLLHVANAAAGLIAAAERGRCGEVYFVTDGEPVVFREFITAMLATQGVAAPTRSVPLPLVRAAASAMSRWAALTRARHEPVLTPAALALVAQEMTVSDSKARRELGYTPVVTVEEGLGELRQRHFAGAGAASG
jgi:nucleoside-diphosphate-sugar epimerase